MVSALHFELSTQQLYILLYSKKLWVEIYFYLLMYLSFFCFSLLSIISIFRIVFKEFVFAFTIPFTFFRNYESSCISGTSINDWFLKISITQTNRKCKAFHFAWFCKIQIECSFFFNHFFSWYCLIFNFNEVRTDMELELWNYMLLISL